MDGLYVLLKTMSDIDLINHSRIGQFGRIPVYLCHEDGCWLGQPVREPSSIAIRNAICVGGGSGEHPAAVCNAPWHCVRAFVSQSLEADPEVVFCDGLTEAEWERRFYSDFAPYREDMTFSRWMAECVGEFIFFMVPDIDERIQELRLNHSEILQPIYEVISIPWHPYSAGPEYWKIQRQNKS